MKENEGIPYTGHTRYLQDILPQIILNNDHLVVFCSDDSGKIFLWNRAAEIITGYSHDEIPDVATAFRVAYPDNTYREIIARVRDSFREKENKFIHYETKIKTKNGHIRYMSWTVERIPETNTTPLFYVTTGTDVTHTRQSENDALLLSEIVNSSHDAIIGISRMAQSLHGTALQRICSGMGEAESIGKPFSRHIPDDKKTFITSVLRNVSKGQYFNGNIICLTKTEQRITVGIAFSPISGEDGTVDGISAIIRDLTREQSLQQTMKGYISEATMRLNHPTELVEGNIASLIERIGEGEYEDEDILIELQVQQKALLQIIHNLRELSQAVIGHFKEIEEEIAPDNIQ
ncbi:PAS domain S-box protein [Methanogenium cariaci]|uniref:PAS domain-containing protein n=1 Tax=Methanogenium cariaci TaxID=2197 RepID=UPI000785652F|nr:PAS domain S-box protein [Methanogenium cariaci]